MTGDADRREDAGDPLRWDDELGDLLRHEERAGRASPSDHVTEPTAGNIAAGGGFWVDPTAGPPLVALVPLSSYSTSVAGSRVRRRSGEGDVWLADLRAWAEPSDGVVRLVHEADWYRLRVAHLEPPLLPISYDVDVAGVYVEQYVTSPDPTASDDSNPNAWLGRVHEDRLNPPPIAPVQARRAGPLLGRRAIICSQGDIVTGVRVVSEPLDDGQGIVVNTIGEADWHVHAGLNPGVDVWRSFRAVPIDQLWVEG
jgi:hypothetical protein